MTQHVKIAIDAMGGDFAPHSVIEGINIFFTKLLKNGKNIKFLLFGNAEKIHHCYSKLLDSVKPHCEIIHTEDEVLPEWSVVEALRRGESTSMWQAINSVATGDAHAVVSAGNTGALMAISKRLLNMLPNISRPAIVSMLPGGKGSLGVTFLDLGANASCTAQHLAEFAIMGDAFCKVATGKRKPRIAILNIGSENQKGNVVVKSAAKILDKYYRQGILNYVGYIEGNYIFNNVADVIVTDGFTGNVGLKIMEGTSKYVSTIFKSTLKGNMLSKIGSLFLLPALLKLRSQVDPRTYNGAMLIGLNGVSVKSHGGSDAVSFAHSLRTTHKLIVGKVNNHIENEIKQITQIPSDDSQEKSS